MTDPAPPPTAGLPAAIGQYPVERELGRGGMGVVYLARDPRLNRPVAIKVLPAAFVADPVRLQRFEREARTLAALNHRNVGMIFGLEDDPAGGGRLLVLEFIPGQTLTAMLGRGALPLDEAVRVCLQIAEGLEAAHERDVVHRDLKPDNVRVTPEGLVKILDFGLASAGTEAREAQAIGLTREGMVMGTPGYMSPEQARGLPTDKRSDIWALGCVLYECLTGHRAFGGETVSDCLVAVIEREPDFTLLPGRTPGRLRELLRRCLVKDARRRLRDVGDARIELEDVLTQPQSGWYQAVAGAGGGRAAGPARLVMPLCGPGAGSAELALSNSPRGAVAVSPDGSAVAFVAGRPQATLYVRRMDGLDARPVPGSAGADGPFFSPDGARLGFFADGKLKRVALTGGAPAAVAPAPRPQGGCWADDEHIYFVPDWGRGIQRVPAAAAPGAPAESVAEPDLATGELAFVAPEVLPGSRHALVSVWTGSEAGHEGSLITAIDLRTRARRPLIHGGTNPRFLPSGHIVFSRGGTLLAVAFDPQRLEVFGAPAPVEDRVLGNGRGGASHFGVGAEGTLAVARGDVWEPRGVLALAGKGADASPVPVDPRAFAGPSASPNGRLLCVQAQGVTDDLYLYDLERPGGAGTRLTFHGDNSCPVFLPDNRRVVFRSTMSGRAELYALGVDLAGPGAAQPVYAGDPTATPCGVLPGGGVLFTQARAGGGPLEIWSVSLDDPASAAPLVQGPSGVWGAGVSPDGRLLAYVSDESGRPEVYVQAFPAGPRRQVSTEGGSAPLWARSGGELFYRSGPGGEQIIAARIAIEPTLMVGRPRVMFQGAIAPATPHARNYDALPDGQFVILRVQEDAARVTALNVTLNWFAELRRRAPVPAPATPTRLSGMTHAASPWPAGPAFPSRPASTPIPSAMPTSGDGMGGPPPPRPAYPSEANTIG